MHNTNVSVIIAAAGNSSRMGGGISKQLIDIGGKSVIEYSLHSFSTSEYVKEIIITTKQDEIEQIRSYKTKYPKIKSVVIGGSTRLESVNNALREVDEACDYIAVHDAARPLITTEDINAVIEDAFEYGASCPASQAVDTIKFVDDGFISFTLNRNHIFLASTPQVFLSSIYKNAVYSLKKDTVFTDDASIVEAYGQKVHIFIMNKDNTKLTTPKDLTHIKNTLSQNHPSMRVGHGYDVHKLVEGRKLILGGVDIPHCTGLLGHSDADVLIHAIMDSLLGAAGLRDIGYLFPDSDDKYKDISSLHLLKAVSEKISVKGLRIINIDATVIAQQPKLSPFISKMIENVSEVLDIDTTAVNIKATTEEGLGFTGEKLGISAHCVCLLGPI